MKYSFIVTATIHAHIRTYIHMCMRSDTASIQTRVQALVRARARAHDCDTIIQNNTVTHILHTVILEADVSKPPNK